MRNDFPVWHQIEINPDAEDHLAGFAARTRSIILDAIEERLSYDPLVETRNRKRLRGNPLAPWELRVSKWRVFYDVAEEPEPTVTILAVGEKRRDELWIGGRRIRL